MKRSIILGLAMLAVSVTAYAAAEGCVVTGVLGDATVMRNDTEIAVQKGDSLMKGDLVKTSADGQMDMSMNDLAGCRMLPGSAVRVESWKSENMSLKVESGNVVLNLKELPKASSFKIETPAAVATVRGTQFWGRVNPSADSAVTTFAVRKGSVEISPVGGAQAMPVMLEAGQAIDISTKESSYAVRDALPEEMAAMEQADQISNTA